MGALCLMFWPFGDGHELPLKTRQLQSEANHKSRSTHKHKSLAPINSTHLKRQQEYLFNKEQIALMVCFEIVHVECR